MWRKPSDKEVAKMLGVTEYEVKKEKDLRKKGIVFLKYKSLKRERKKVEIIKKIVESLPCTFSVLRRKTSFSKPTLSRYLRKLQWLDVVIKMFDSKTEKYIYYLNPDYDKSRNPNKCVKCPFESLCSSFCLFDVLDSWRRLPEYKIPSAIGRKEKLAVKLAMAGKKVKIKPKKK